MSARKRKSALIKRDPGESDIIVVENTLAATSNQDDDSDAETTIPAKQIKIEKSKKVKASSEPAKKKKSKPREKLESPLRYSSTSRDKKKGRDSSKSGSDKDSSFSGTTKKDSLDSQNKDKKNIGISPISSDESNPSSGDAETTIPSKQIKTEKLTRVKASSEPAKGKKSKPREKLESPLRSSSTSRDSKNKKSRDSSKSGSDKDSSFSGTTKKDSLDSQNKDKKNIGISPISSDESNPFSGDAETIIPSTQIKIEKLTRASSEPAKETRSKPSEKLESPLRSSNTSTDSKKDKDSSKLGSDKDSSFSGTTKKDSLESLNKDKKTIGISPISSDDSNPSSVASGENPLEIDEESDGKSSTTSEVQAPETVGKKPQRDPSMFDVGDITSSSCCSTKSDDTISSLSSF